MPDEWRTHVQRWRELNAPFVKAVDDLPTPGPNEEYLLYQTLVGAYPFSRDPKGSAPEDFTTRIQSYMQKALREAKQFTSWTNPNAPYEAAIDQYIERIISHPPFLDSFHPFLRRVAHFGLLNSLSQSLLRLCAPGVPDTYQGTELWDFSLVDPDNRRPVDYALRQKLIEGAGRSPARELLRSMEDGRVKMLITNFALRSRREHPGLFAAGEYLPLRATGARADHVFAFTRRQGERSAVVIVPRFVTRITDDLPLGPDVWQDTRIALPFRSSLTDLFTGKSLIASGELRLADVLADFPVALLMG
jgi:(1->4)-alpha-D-glucan 1-alpha-D-glucosylmutase